MPIKFFNNFIKVATGFACDGLTDTRDIMGTSVTCKPYPCKLCKTEKAFGSRYLKNDKRREEHGVCVTCVIEERTQLVENFGAALLPEQKELYKRYMAAESRVSSIFILD